MEDKPMTVGELKFQFLAHMNQMIAQAQDHYDEAKSLCGHTGYATGYELGRVESLLDYQKYMKSMFKVIKDE